MDSIIEALKSPEACDSFIKKYTQLINQARKRNVELRVAAHGNIDQIESEILKVLYAYEEILTIKNKRKTRASRTWQMVKRHGIIGAAERAVNRKIDPQGYKILVEAGMQDLTFESVIVKHPEAFSPDTVLHAKDRLEEFRKI